MQADRVLEQRQLSFEGHRQVERVEVVSGAGGVHVVQFYERDELLCDAVVDFLGAGLIAGEPVVVIATESHRAAFSQALTDRGFDVAAAGARGQLTVLDAAETLAQLMAGELLSAEKFQAVVGTLIDARLGPAGPRVRAYGEMVDLLWRGGNSAAALRLEELWEDLIRVRPLALLCAYAMGPFYKHPADVHRVCSAHTHVIALEPERSLQAEIEHRKQVERALRESMRDLRFLAEASELLASSLDYRSTLTRLAELVVPRIADGCLIELAPEVSSPGAPLVIAHGQTDAARRSGDDIAIAVPMVVRGVTLGSLVLLADPVVRRFGPAQVAMAEDLGRRAAIAIDNACLVRDAREADRRKDEFLALLGHELRNPLAPILTTLQMLQLRGGATDGLEVIDRQVRHLVRLVDDLLDVSRITRGKVELDREPVELAVVLARAIEMAGPLLEQRSHRLDVEVARHGLVLDGDPFRLAQVLSNLITNAAKYTDPYGHIAIIAGIEGGAVVVSVTDDGIGIAPDMLPRIFDLFVQSEQGLDRSQGGLGIGLALARSLVEAHGGTIAARSAGLGEGSEFTICLPLMTTQPHLAPPTLVASSSAARPASGRRVLVVDDNIDAAEALADVLRDHGHEVEIAHDGPQALAIAPAFAPEVALLDIGLPGMDGFELARRFRALAPGLQTRLIALTGYGQEADRARSLSAGFDVHLVKPIDVVAMMALLAERSGPA